MAKTFHAIVDLNNVVSKMCDALTDEKLGHCAKTTQVQIPQLRVFWMDFAFSHLVNSVGCGVDHLGDGSTVNAQSFIDLYCSTLKTELSERDFDSCTEIELGKFGLDFVLPTLAGLISPLLLREVMDELEEDTKQAV